LAKVANPKISDLEKIGDEREDGGRDPFAVIKKAMDDGVYDEMTCNMLQWYIAEEYDSGKRLREAYKAVRGRANGKRKATNGANGHDADVPSADAEAIMACMTSGFAKLEKSLEKLARAVK
jgi:hypothetical protein